MNQIKFSLITISFNSEKTIERTIESVLKQTYNNYEYIIIDGASKDRTLEIIHNYKEYFAGKIKIISEPDKGIYDAMNKGIKVASGEIIGIVNSDDWLEPTALQTIYDAYKKNNNSLNTLYVGWMNFHYKDGTFQILKTSNMKFKKMARVYQMAGIFHPATFVPMSIYNRIGLFDDRMSISADADFILRCYYNNILFSFVDKVLTNMKDDGVSNNGTMKILKKSYRDRKLLLNKYVNNSFCYYYYQLIWIVKILIKNVIPSSILKFYRN